jgi:phage terminase large subunit
MAAQSSIRSRCALSEAVFPKALKFLFKPSRYKVARGGRGSGKSWGFARALILRCMERQTRVLCTREIQKSIQQSVHQLLSDQIEQMGVSDVFEVLHTEIRGPNGSCFYFSGLSDITATSLKSFEGVDICWCEEAQAISAKSWKTLIPTIRKEGSEIWVTYNPELETDPTHQMFVVNPPEDCTSVLMNWSDNPYFPEVLKAEREHAEKTMKSEEYRNVWEGECLPAVTGAIYFDEVATAEREGRIRDVPIDPLLKTHAIWDLGWNDSMSIVLVQRSASELRIVDYIEDSHRTLDDYVRQLNAMPINWGTHYLPHDGFAKDFKTGKSAQEILEALGCSVEQTPNMAIEEGIRAARMTFGRIYFDKTKAGRLIECLKRYRRIINKQTNEASSPLHDEYSHGCLDGDSLISTARGLVAIRDIVVGDMVETPAGYAHVSASGVTKIATEIVEMTLVDGSILLMTPEHKVFTTRGVVLADSLGDNDAIFTMESAPCLSFQSIKSAGYRDALIESFKGKNTGFGLTGAFTQARSVASSVCFTLKSIAQFMVSLTSGLRLNASMGICATQAQTTGLSKDQSEIGCTKSKRLTGFASTTSQRVTTSATLRSTEASPCTATFGKNTMAEFLKGCTFTTLMETSQTIALKIWNCFQPVTTAHTTASQIHGSEVMQTSDNSLALTIKPKHGTLVQRVWSGIGVMESQLGQIVKCTLKAVQNAASLMKLLGLTSQSSAIRIAKLRRITGAEAIRPVYDLTVDHHHCYVANGMLVSNCDAFRYTAIVADSLGNSNGSMKPIKYTRKYIS